MQTPILTAIPAAQMGGSQRGANPRLHIRSLIFEQKTFSTKKHEKMQTPILTAIPGPQMGGSWRGANPRLHIRSLIFERNTFVWFSKTKTWKNANTHSDGHAEPHRTQTGHFSIEGTAVFCMHKKCSYRRQGRFLDVVPFFKRPPYLR